MGSGQCAFDVVEVENHMLRVRSQQIRIARTPEVFDDDRMVRSMNLCRDLGFIAGVTVEEWGCLAQQSADVAPGFRSKRFGMRAKLEGRNIDVVFLAQIFEKGCRAQTSAASSEGGWFRGEKENAVQEAILSRRPAVCQRANCDRGRRARLRPGPSVPACFSSPGSRASIAGTRGVGNRRGS